MVVTNARDEFIGVSAATRSLVADIERAAESDAKVLITGESGVGKEIAARLIHRRSGRSARPIVPVNCAGIPDALLESELFGHARGSFTDAYRDRVGKLEVAHGGTVFLDEMGEMSPRMQAMLLRFLETGEIQRVGATGSAHTIADVRVIAATNRSLADRIASGDLREDLYYRLNVINIAIPPLRARPEDIPVLLRHFFTAYARTHRLDAPQVSSEAMAALTAYRWPGNVRELRNVVERLTVRRRSSVITPFDLPLEISGAPRPEQCQPRLVTSIAQTLFNQMIEGRQTFWSAVYSPFMARDLTRSDLREIVAKGFQSAGSYKTLAQNFNIAPSDYRRFVTFLRTHGCDIRFQLFGAVAARRSSTNAFPRVVAADRGRRTEL